MKRKITPYIYILFFAFNFQDVIAQNFQLKVIAIDTVNASFLNAISFQKYHTSKKSVIQEIDSISLRLSSIGFIDNGEQFTKEVDSVITAGFKLGFNSEFIKLSYNSKFFSKKFLKQLGIEYDATYIYTQTKYIPILLNKIVNELDKQGSSFSKISLKNISKNESGLTAQLHIDKSSLRTIDNIVIKGYDNFPKTYTKHFLKLRKGTVFTSEKINQISSSIQSIPFTDEIKPPEILFEKDSTTIYLYLQKRKTNKFDGLIGFNTNDDGKLKFNGYLDLYLSNLFNRGESFSMYWKSNSEDRKTFNLSITAPYLFNTPFSIGGSLNIHKQDSTFLNTKANFNLSYQITTNQQFSGKLISENSNEINQSENPITEFSNVFYGATYNFRKPDPLRPFQNKFYFDLNGLWGTRENSSQNISEKQSKYRLVGSFIWNHNNFHSVYIKNESALLQSNTYYINELYRIGGAASIRGFKEESLFSSGYSILNIEYRYYLNQTSKIYSISDLAYVQNKANSSESKLFGFGLGYSYNTGQGFVDVSYAIGKQHNTPIDFKNSTFHVKFVQRF